MEEDNKQLNGAYELDITWEELEAQREANERKTNPPAVRPKKYI
jgi:hypothetical protein